MDIVSEVAADFSSDDGVAMGVFVLGFGVFIIEHCDSSLDMWILFPEMTCVSAPLLLSSKMVIVTS